MTKSLESEARSYLWEVRLHADNSKETQELVEDLEKFGYKVKKYSSGGIPKAFAKGNVSFGYAEIRLDFIEVYKGIK